LLTIIFFLFSPPQSPIKESHCCKMFCLWICIWSLLYLCMHLPLDLSSTYERKHSTFVFLNLAYLMWWSPVPSIYKGWFLGTLFY
jgi:hypothetical protein